MKRLLFAVAALLSVAGLVFSHPHPGGGGGGGKVEHEKGLALGLEYAGNQINEGDDAEPEMSFNANYGHGFLDKALTVDLQLSYTFGFWKDQFIDGGKRKEYNPQKLNVNLLAGYHHKFNDDASKLSLFLQNEFEEIRFPFGAYQKEEAKLDGNLEIHTANNYDARFTPTFGYEQKLGVGTAFLQIGVPVKWASHNIYADTEYGLKIVPGLETNFGLAAEAWLGVIFQPELSWERQSGLDELGFNFTYEFEELMGKDLNLTLGLESSIPLNKNPEGRGLIKELGITMTPSLEVVWMGHFTFTFGLQMEHIASVDEEKIVFSPTVGFTFGY